MEEKKEYYFSYAKIHDDLKHYLSVNFDKYAEATELEILCEDYLAPERVGNHAYGEIEWHKFGVTSRHLKKIIGWLNNPMESLRVMVYFRDHPQEILGQEADESAVRTFERACCKEVNEIMKDFKNQREEYGYPWARVLEYGYWHQYNDMEDISLWGKGCQLIAKHLPYYISFENCYRPFPADTVISVAIIKHYHLLLDINETPQELLNGEISDWFNMDSFAVETCDQLIFEEQRLLPESNTPLMQTLFVISVLLLTERDHAYKDERLKPLYKKLSDYIMGYLKEHYELYFMWGEEKRTEILAQCEGMNYLDFARTDEYLEQIKLKEELTVEKTETENVPVISEENKEIPDYRDTKVRVSKLKEIYKTLQKDLGKVFKGGSQWFYVYKLMADCKIYEDRSYQLFLNDLNNAGVAKTDMPNPVTFTRKYNQLQRDSRYPYWRVKSGGKQATLDEGLSIARIAYDILYM